MLVYLFIAFFLFRWSFYHKFQRWTFFNVTRNWSAQVRYKQLSRPCSTRKHYTAWRHAYAPRRNDVDNGRTASKCITASATEFIKRTTHVRKHSSSQHSCLPARHPPDCDVTAVHSSLWPRKFYVQFRFTTIRVSNHTNHYSVLLPNDRRSSPIAKSSEESKPLRRIAHLPWFQLRFSRWTAATAWIVIIDVIVATLQNRLRSMHATGRSGRKWS